MIPHPIRVLHINAVETSNYYLNNLVDCTDANDIRIAAATTGSDRGFISELHRRGVRAFALECHGKAKHLKALRRLFRMVERERPHVIHTHLFFPSLVGLAVAKHFGLHAVVTRHHSDAIHRLPTNKRFIYRTLENWINRTADHIIAPSLAVREILTRREGVPESKVSLIPYGQTKARFDSVRREPVAEMRRALDMDDGLAFVCVSRLHVEKGHRYLFEAFAKLLRSEVRARLYLLGEGAELAALRSLAQRLGIEERIRFLGWRDDALSIVAAADVFVHPSLHEALPSAVIEAAMLEKPMIATDVSGIRDILGDNEHGLVVPPGDTEPLYRALVETSRNLKHARRRARLGRRHVLEYMDANRVARDYAACYRNLWTLLQPGSAEHSAHASRRIS